MKPIIMFEILKAIYDECYFSHKESISISIIARKHLTTYNYLYRNIKILSSEGLLEWYAEDGHKFVNLTSKGKEKVEAYIALTN